MDSQKSNGRPVILSETAYHSIAKVVEDLAASTRADVIVFADANGYPILHKGTIENLDLSVISSLAASNFSATAKMAAMIGENDSFKFLFHEGEKTNMYLSNVGFNFILLVIFKVEVALGMVRVFTRKAIEELITTLNTMKQDEEKTKEVFDLEFKTLLSEELDRSFKF
jgi:predicted regulator of Ras-like GTPase activity (Roadblock/LC7/MglB family)